MLFFRGDVCCFAHDSGEVELDHVVVQRSKLLSDAAAAASGATCLHCTRDDFQTWLRSCRESGLPCIGQKPEEFTAILQA